MIRTLILATGFALALLSPALADPPKYEDEAKAIAWCKAGNVVWFNPDSHIYFEKGSRFYGNTKHGGYACRNAAEKEKYRANKGN